MKSMPYRCPVCKSELSIEAGVGLRCSNAHTFEFVEGTTIPLFDSENSDANEYTISNAAEIHENALRWVFNTYSTSEEELRENLLSRLRLVAGQKVLITGVGGGNDLPYLAGKVGKNGIIFAQDYAGEMLLSAVERSADIYGLAEYNIEFSISDATNLPFHDGYFDAVFHFGGLNLFSDVAAGISEMDRVVKDGGRVVFGDEGLAPWLKDTDYGRMIINNNPLLNFSAPLEHIPTTARHLNLSWDPSYCFYIIDYTAAKEPLPLNIDVPHVGTRGGSIRTRYFGQLEGVDPDLKAALYAEAKKRGIDRVSFLEAILRDGLERKDDNG
ncbi:methyltransferase domain-containing protein [Sneathiella sp.]|jgi:SAM-dependent methyltransferase|uniref:methyltransferase domain-containing protein n=1 Tax=Sneathiella sp. TaxID=1964365 RepID=UPI0025FCBB18|nr:methyltransferase domain-containing protein [Sneathiella sp.]